MSREIYRDIVSPVLDRLDSEAWHIRAREALHLAEANPFTLKLLEQFAYQRKRFTDKRLQVVLGGIQFDNPLVVGAGWDKVGRAVKALYTLGFSGVEVGSVLTYPQPGKSKPRQFMISSGVALNRLGFNSPGVDEVALNLRRYRKSGIPIGISLGKNKEVEPKYAPEAHAIVARRLYEDAAYFVINVSSPNTPGLRKLQDKGPLTDIVQAVNGVMDKIGERKPTFVKISPDLTNEAVDDVIRVVADNGLAGIIATNTTIRPELKAKYGEQWRDQAGGLSGNDPEFRRMATEKVAHIYRETGGKMEIIGIGGVKDTETTLEKIRAGARIVQIVTAIRGEGTTLSGKINSGIIDYMEQEGISNLNEIIGSDVH
ncbi:MAG: quinone-dependent dihydroorotate dehydrogenase [Candidatus Daviesbacteria bacterium]|nr:quinone-dependent dihydroorotate dehydrogenase [Candidatus Daviesbacteria bacterium]